MAYMQKSLRPLETVPGFLFIDALGNGWGRKIHGQVRVGGAHPPTHKRRRRAHTPSVTAWTSCIMTLCFAPPTTMRPSATS
eukprot:16557-Eustigmatos_ZCMA.PRE.1